LHYTERLKTYIATNQPIGDIKMKSQKQIERDYNKLMNDVATLDYYKTDLTNRVNCYTCQKCGHITKTKDIDSGVIPFMFTCEKCGNIAYSSFFEDIAPLQEPTFEWYRPTLKQILKMRKKRDSMLDHIFNGGLDYRKIKQ
jgi:RNase P subunit RPR2